MDGTSLFARISAPSKITLQFPNFSGHTSGHWSSGGYPPSLQPANPRPPQPMPTNGRASTRWGAAGDRKTWVGVPCFVVLTLCFIETLATVLLFCVPTVYCCTRVLLYVLYTLVFRKLKARHRQGKSKFSLNCDMPSCVSYIIFFFNFFC